MIFYDFEVFKHLWMVHFVDVINKEELTIVNDPDKLKEYYEKNVDNIWVGFNNNHYDQYIFKGILLGMDPWDINNKIINQKMMGWQISNLFNQVKMYNYDVFLMGKGGLKKLEGFMGHNIKETSVDFRIDRKLTDAEILEVVEYCKYDVNETIEVFLRRVNYFNTKMDLIKEFKLPLSNISRTNAQLSSIVLGALKRDRSDTYDLNFPKELDINKYDEVVRWYKNPINHNEYSSLELNVSGVPTVFRWGGVHGVIPNYIEEGKFVLVDVSSYYPSLMIEYDYMSRNVSNPKLFEEMYKERFRLRALGDNKQEIFKLVLNTTYGCMGAEFNNLYDPLMRNNVCVTGQLFLLDLMEKLEDIKGVNPININTDGILVRYENDKQLEDIKKVSAKLSERTRMNLGYDYYYKVIQKDVNNYIALAENEDYNVFVGAYVQDQNDLDYDLPIVNRALREYFINGICVEDTINNENRLREFQKIVTVSYKFDAAMHNNEELTEKTLRVFASKDRSDTKVTRFRMNKGKHQNMKFSNTSDNSFIDNSDVTEKLIPRKLDKQWYINLAKRRVEHFTNKGYDANQLTMF